jgi:hypothetical protein
MVCVAVTELALKSPFKRILIKFRLVAGKAAHVVRAKAVSDHWKQKAMLAYARKVFILTGALALLLLGLAGVLIIFVACAGFIGATTKEFLISRNGILLSIVVTIAYLKLRSLLVRL